MQYSNPVMDHFLHPRRAGTMPDASGSGIARYPTCGDVTRIFVKVVDGVLDDARFQGTGCGPGISCASMLLDMAVGRPVESALALSARAVADALELPEAKLHCAQLAVSALRAALESLPCEGGEAR